tara:strand:- start:31680 stop:32147 length:468 start_codon:yes stop_codon:yes gene_type:complete
MLNVKQLREYVIRPVLRELNAHSDAAELLLLGTAAQESRFEYIHQLGGGPALGLWQMEPATHNDIVNNYLQYRPELAAAIFRASGCAGFAANNLLKNLSYACAMARVHYLRVREALPADLDGQAAYWKLHYNTPLGKGLVHEYVQNFKKLVEPSL